MDTTNSTRTCLYCAKELKGRKDKKFCNEGCRNTFHNELNSPVNEIVNPIINILKRNRSILLGFLEKDMQYLDREQLLKAGYDFQYYTERMYSGSDHLFFCFDVGIHQLTKNQYHFYYRMEFLKDPL